MEKIRETIGRYLPFAWWVLLAILTFCSAICCVKLAASGIGMFWAISGAIGAAIGTIIFIFQAWGEWLDKNNY